MLWNSTSDAALAALNGDRRQQAERQRREAFAKRFLLMSGNFLDLVRAEVRSIFATPELAERVAIVCDSSINVFRYVTEQVYAFKGAKRAFRRGDAEDPVYAKIRDELVDFDLITAEEVEALGAYNDCLVQTLAGVVDAAGEVGMPLVRVFLPHEVTVAWDPHNPRVPVEVRYEVDTGEEELVTVVWTAAEHYEIGPRGIPRPVNGAADTKNPYGRLPFIAVHAGLRSSSGWDTETGTDRYHFGVQLLAQWSSIRHILHQESYKALARTGCDETDVPFAMRGPGVEFMLPTGQSLDVLDMHSDPSAQVETLKASLSQHLASHGLNPEKLGMNPGQAPPSGIARYMERQELLERRKKSTPHIVEAECDFADLYRFMWNFNHEDKIAEDATFEVEIIEETVILSPLEKADLRTKQIANIRAERELGLTTEAEQVAEYRGCSVDEAERFLSQRGAASSAATE